MWNQWAVYLESIFGYVEVKGDRTHDVIHQGPKLQQDLAGVLLRFRRYPVAHNIAEMYLRICVHPQHWAY